MTPRPTARLVERLRHVEDGVRALLAALDRAALRGGGPVVVTLEAGPCGEVLAVEVAARYERRPDEPLTTVLP